jgi:hypothetical protein
MKLAWAISVVVATVAPALQAQAPLGDDTVAISFSREVGRSQSEALEIARVGNSSFTTNYNHNGRPEIGRWQHPVTSERFEELLTLVKRSGYEQIPSLQEMPPEPHVVVFGERKAGQTRASLHLFDGVPPVLAPVVAMIETLRSELLAHPVRVLRGEAKWSEVVAVRGRRSRIELRLTNVGNAELSFPNPLAHSEGWNGLRLALRPASGGEEHQVDLSDGDVSSAGRDRDPTLSLAPGQTVRLELRPKLDLPTGKYSSRLEYHSLQRLTGDTKLVCGTLALPMADLAVKR